MNEHSAVLNDRGEARASRRAVFCPVFQPVANLQTGAIVGFEALARFEVAGIAITPDSVLHHLESDELLSLFCRMVEHAVALTRTLPVNGPYVSVNVEAGLLLADGFCDLLQHLLDKAGGEPGRIVLEMLEGERVDDHGRMGDVLTRLRALGIAVALDDLGSGYASLINLQRLPVDIIKLDRSFALDLRRKPHDLLFILALANLARGLGRRLIVEGVETGDALEALSLLGIEFAQGFAIAKPMPAAAIEAWIEHWTTSWLAGQQPFRRQTNPTTLLGAYASHLTVMETCRMLQLHPMRIEWTQKAHDWHNCRVGRFFSQAGLHDTCCGLAHRRFHEVIDRYTTDRDAWERAAFDFRDELAKAMSA